VSDSLSDVYRIAVALGTSRSICISGMTTGKPNDSARMTDESFVISRKGNAQNQTTANTERVRRRAPIQG
jgi:hypothetical protein